MKKRQKASHHHGHRSATRTGKGGKCDKNQNQKSKQAKRLRSVCLRCAVCVSFVVVRRTRGKSVRVSLFVFLVVVWFPITVVAATCRHRCLSDRVVRNFWSPVLSVWCQSCGRLKNSYGYNNVSIISV